ncbi:MAG: rhomboid family intramembrane serine protease [Candidatus Delongbacteria bacterium]|nr:rhomboid family intramembrane serine protease [Candidatus Delongbacteria bacterium]
MQNQYSYRPTLRQMLPQGVRWLLGLNIGMFILQSLLKSSFWVEALALLPSQVIPGAQIWRLVSYMFLHGGLWHLLLNMLVLWMFGSELERRWGTRLFLRYYFVTGIGAALFGFLTYHEYIIGASGAIYALMLAYGMLFPDRIIYLYAVLPVKAKYFVMGLLVISLLSGIGGSFSAGRSGGGIAHFIHLGGMLVGYIYLRWDRIERWWRSQRQEQRMKQHRTNHDREQQKMVQVEKQVDELLGRISESGFDSLSEREKTFLKDASDWLVKHRKRD